MQPLLDLYNSIHLKLGIKRFLNHFIFSQRNINWIDNYFLYPFYLFLDRYFYLRIIYHYGADYRWGDEKSQNLDKKNYNFGYGQVHYTFIRNQRPKRILCLGSMYGFIPYMMARACKENHYGHVDFVDASYDIHDKKYSDSHYFGQGFWKKASTKDHFRYLGVNDYITTYVMTLEEFTNKHKFSYEYIYLDADHSYEGSLQALHLFWPRLMRGGFLSFHDIHFNFAKLIKDSDNKNLQSLAGKLEFGVDKLWKKLQLKVPYKIEIPNSYSGLGLIQKMKNDDIPPHFFK